MMSIMKPSTFNVWVPVPGAEDHLVFNTRTLDTVRCSAAQKALLTQAAVDTEVLPATTKATVEWAAKRGFLVDKELDEVALLRHMYHMIKYDRSQLLLTVVPTLSCNFRCPYCYIPGHHRKGSAGEPAVVMSEEVMRAILSFVRIKARPLTRMSVHWYGGEPLLALNTVSSLTREILEICSENSIHYTSAMTSNGYLATPEVIREMKACHIESVQISLDGPPSTHNRTRFVPGKDGATFDRIIENIRSMQEAGIQVRVRINTISKERGPLEELVARFLDEGIRGAGFYLGHVYPLTSQAAKGAGSEHLTFEEYIELNHWFICLKIEQGLEPDIAEYFPDKIKLCMLCAANLYNQLVVDPEGELSKCLISLGKKEQSCGNIRTKYTAHSDLSRMRELEWVEWSPFDRETCCRCTYLPLCLGSCRYRQAYHEKDPYAICTNWRFKLPEALLKHHAGRAGTGMGRFPSHNGVGTVQL